MFTHVNANFTIYKSGAQEGLHNLDMFDSKISQN